MVATIIGGLWWWLKPNRLVSDASSMMQALTKGDGEQLLRYAGRQEIACSDLTPDRLNKAWTILIKPLLDKSKLVKRDPIDNEVSPTQAVAEHRYVTDKGDPWSLTIIANQSDSGAKSIIVGTMLNTASIFDENGNANASITSELALRGVHRFRSRLEAIGIHRIALGPSRCVTWDELEEALNSGMPKND